MIQYDIANRLRDLEQIQQLQEQNVPQSISSDELKSQGFVTARHDVSLLEKMNRPYPHIVARSQGNVVGYTLVMLQSFSDSLPVLIPMFQRINTLKYKGIALNEVSWFIMGQVCIGKDFRGQGIFSGLYQELKTRMQADFQYNITQISKRNTRSIRAHEKVGYKTIHEYWDEAANEDWLIVLWDWK